MARRKKSRYVQQIKNVQKRYRQTVDNIDKQTEKRVTEMLILIQNRATFYTPQDTGALINSQYREVRKDGRGVVGRVGYTQNYAAALHNRTDWRPLRPDERNPPGGGYNPNAVPRFLERGAEEAIPDIKALLSKGYNL